MPARTRTLLALAATAAALASGCGEGPTVTQRTRTFTITLDDYLIRPQRIRVPKGGPLTITVHNRGRLGHTFRIRSANHNVMVLTTIPPGGTRRRAFRLRAGRYTMYCALSNHEELGMHGTLVVG
jgi:plastocyanin